MPQWQSGRRIVRATRSLRTAALAVTFLAQHPSVAGEPRKGAARDPYVRKPTWQETALASRGRHLRLREESGDAEAVALGPWYSTATLKAKGFAHKLFPEREIDLAAKDEAGKPLWRKRPEFMDGHVHDLPSGGSSTTYLFRTLTVRKPMKPRVGFGSDDGLQVWLDGESVLVRDVARGPGVDQDVMPLDLAEGEHRLLLKIYNRGGGHGFYFCIGERKTGPGAKLWARIARDFPTETAWMRDDVGEAGMMAWLESADGVEIEERMVGRALGQLGSAGADLRRDLDRLRETKAAPDDRRWLDLYVRTGLRRRMLAQRRNFNIGALRLAIEDLAKAFPKQYARGGEFLGKLDELERRVAEGKGAVKDGSDELMDQLLALQREALLANPLLDFDRLLLVKRSTRSRNLGLPQNWQGNCAVAKTGYDNEIAALSPVSPAGKLTTFFRPRETEFVGDVDLNFDADRMLLSMPGSHGRWQIWEVGSDGGGLRQVTPGEHRDVDNYDACYLPDGRIIFASTRCFHGVPCVGGGNTVANLCVMNSDGTGIRQVCFDQDHNWCPTVTNGGRVLYTRWEYSDSPHYFTRLLFGMNPDGTGQAEYYGSNSYWPNSMFYARPVPGHPTKIVAVVSGHHGVARMGELVVIDPARGRHEADGAVQRIPGHGKDVPPIIRDGLVEGSWPKFLHPYPLSDRYFLVSCRPTKHSLWGVYLVDVFDNMLLLHEEPGYAMLEPLPFRKTRTPPVIPDKVRPGRRDATVYLADVYAGPGLAGVPRGIVKKLRVYEYHYAYPRMGGHINIGIDGPWDVHRIRGTVPVNEDGSALFKVPANVPLAVQPLDEEGKALQVMRSWYTAMPGEFVTCIGCHDRQNAGPPSKPTVAARMSPEEIEEWYGPPRGFSFKREVQPVLDKFCVGCHDGKPREDGKVIPDLADTGRGWHGFTKSYVALHPYVRRPGPESDYHVQKPLEWHADTSELVQMLAKGHQNVKLDDEARDRLVTWIDLNVPDHGTWGEHRRIAGDLHARRLESRTKYADRPEDPEAYPAPPPGRAAFVKPEPGLARPRPDAFPVTVDWPFDAAGAKERQAAASADGGLPRELKLDLGGGKTMELVLIPAGEFPMGDPSGFRDESPASAVAVRRPFYMGRFEVTNEQYALFDAEHESGVISAYNKDMGNRGEAASRERQPVIRVPWRRAVEFCEWLSDRTGAKAGGKTGRRFRLPTEAQWEYACRAGTSTPLNYGACGTDFGKLANLADERVNNLCRRDSPKWIPSVKGVNDGSIVTDNVGKYRPNAWGLHDMHGNVCEWTRSLYRPYPYRDDDGRNDLAAQGRRVARGGSFHDRPERARSGFRLAYHPWQSVYNVGFRVVCKVAPAAEVAKAPASPGAGR